MDALQPIRDWLQQPAPVAERAAATKAKGFSALLIGAAATSAKAAGALGKEYKKTVHRVALSQLVSKHIGETEKNLEAVFNKAKGKDWILFFDEADALFGKRTDIKDAHDRFANQATNHLLQQIEGYNGLTIIATSGKAHIDEGFIRRFRAVVHFPPA